MPKPEITAEQAIMRLAAADAEWKRARKERRIAYTRFLCHSGDAEVTSKASREAHSHFLSASNEHRTAINVVLRLGRRLIKEAADADSEDRA